MEQEECSAVICEIGFNIHLKKEHKTITDWASKLKKSQLVEVKLVSKVSYKASFLLKNATSVSEYSADVAI